MLLRTTANKTCGILIILVILTASTGVVAAQTEEGEVDIEEDYRAFLLEDVYFAVEFDEQNDCLKLIMPDGSREVLKHKRSASGARYTNDNLTFWNKGSRARIQLEGIEFNTEKVEDGLEKISDYFVGGISKDMVVFKSSGSYVMLQHSGTDRANLILSGKEFTLKKKKTADNVYGNDYLFVRDKGQELLIQVGDYRFKAEAIGLEDFVNKRGFSFKGLGQEPGWFLTIMPDKMKLQLDYARVKLEINPGYYEMKLVDGNIIYEVKTSLFDFKIKLSNKMHSDIMSGRKFPYTVKILSEKNKLTGGGYIYRN